MVDLHGQYLQIKTEIDRAIEKVLNSTSFIQGPEVEEFARSLGRHIEAEHVIPCGNGTDALQIAMMALDLQPGDEVIVPAFTYVATAEVIALLKLKPVFADVEEDNFNIDTDQLEKKITSKTRAIVPVHLYGQCADMESILSIASKFNIHVIEDVAQALGAKYTFDNGVKRNSGTMGIIGTTSFFPSKNLGCYGDGGAIFSMDGKLAEKIKMIANHGQREKYRHELVGVNSRLDTLQAAILNIKIKFLDEYIKKRNDVASYYDNALADIDWLTLPARISNSTHVFHQYTIKMRKRNRDDFQKFLAANGIPSMIYYPIPLHLQKAYQNPNIREGAFPIAESLSKNVLSLPIHTEMNEDQLAFICSTIKKF